MTNNQAWTIPNLVAKASGRPRRQSSWTSKAESDLKDRAQEARWDANTLRKPFQKPKRNGWKASS